MGKLREIIEQPIATRSKTVERNGQSFVVTGMPDANLLGRTVFVTPDHRATRAAHYENVTGCPFDAEIVGEVLLVRECLEHEDDKDARYDEVEIAKLALRDGHLFTQLYLAACSVVGFETDAAETIVEAAAPN